MDEETLSLSDARRLFFFTEWRLAWRRAPLPAAPHIRNHLLTGSGTMVVIYVHLTCPQFPRV